MNCLELIWLIWLEGQGQAIGPRSCGSCFNYMQGVKLSHTRTGIAQGCGVGRRLVRRGADEAGSRTGGGVCLPSSFTPQDGALHN